MENTTKILGTGIGAYLSAKLGILFPILSLLLVAMVLDYCTGLLAAKYEGNIQSRKGMWGIVKKVMYAVAVAVAIMVDWTLITVASHVGISIPIQVFFSLAVAIWLICNELISILENLVRMEVELPGFLQNVVKNFKVVVEKQGETVAENVKKENGEGGLK